jgi:hypothetical protein
VAGFLYNNNRTDQYKVKLLKMVVAGEDKPSSTMLWVQASVVTLEQLHQKSVPVS